MRIGIRFPRECRYSISPKYALFIAAASPATTSGMLLLVAP
jgi:hypothetical protein